jgi:hypothetical protein
MLRMTIQQAEEDLLERTGAHAQPDILRGRRVGPRYVREGSIMSGRIDPTIGRR